MTDLKPVENEASTLVKLTRNGLLTTTTSCPRQFLTIEGILAYFPDNLEPEGESDGERRTNKENS